MLVYSIDIPEESNSVVLTVILDLMMAPMIVATPFTEKFPNSFTVTNQVHSHLHNATG